MKTSLQQIRNRLTKPLRQTTLCLLVRNDEILLAMKKRGFGEGHWNGVGGKLNPGEGIEEAAIRETKEEIGVTAKSLQHVADLHFYFEDLPLEKDWNQQVVVYLVNDWEGEPTESEEMAPQWFKHSEIPYDLMWPDDIHWLPKVLNGKKINAHFILSPNQKLGEFEISEKL